LTRREFNSQSEIMDHSEPSQPGAPVTDSNASKHCVLLVEDDRSLRRYFEVTLQRAGYEVIAAGTGWKR
jgi:hypothetical protein